MMQNIIIAILVTVLMYLLLNPPTLALPATFLLALATGYLADNLGG
jgi:hypothetical protein